MPVKKRKRAGGIGAVAKATRRRRDGAAAGQAARAAAEADATLDSEAEASSEAGDAAAEASDEEQFETPDEKRVRLAKEYLSRLGADRPEQEVREQLTRDVEDQAGRTRVLVEDVQLGAPRLDKQGHRFAVTCVCLSSDDSTAWTGGKDCHVVRYDVETCRKAYFLGGRNKFDCGGHFQPVLSVCPVEPRHLLVSGGVDRVVRFWDNRAPSRSTCSDSLLGHLDAVTGIVAEADGSLLYTSSLDKSLKVWDLRTKRCLDTLFGHVSGVSCMDMHSKSRPVTGGTDKTVRLWKVDKETHLMFNRHTASVDAVTAADQDRFLSGSQDGNLHLWSHASKKPLATAVLGPRSWITALQAVRRGNVVFGGTVDGTLRCWRFARPSGDAAEDGGKGLRLSEVMAPMKLPGVVNGIAVGKKILACAVGKEHRLGRWYYDKSQKNGLLLMPLSYHEG